MHSAKCFSELAASDEMCQVQLLHVDTDETMFYNINPPQNISSIFLLFFTLDEECLRLGVDAKQFIPNVRRSFLRWSLIQNEETKFRGILENASLCNPYYGTFFRIRSLK